MADEYIRKADAIGAIWHSIDGELFGELESCAHAVIGDADNAIESLEPADVVPVVRCENCVHWSDSNHCERPELAGNRWHDDKYFETLPDDFCSYGEMNE